MSSLREWKLQGAVGHKLLKAQLPDAETADGSASAPSVQVHDSAQVTAAFLTTWQFLSTAGCNNTGADMADHLGDLSYQGIDRFLR